MEVYSFFMLKAHRLERSNFTAATYQKTKDYGKHQD